MGEQLYQLKGLLLCVLCGRCFEGHWVSNTPGYRCRHGHSSARDPDTPRVNAYLREDAVFAKLPLLHHLLTATEPTTVITGAPASATLLVPASPEEVIDHLRANALVLRYDPRTRTLETGGKGGAGYARSAVPRCRRHTGRPNPRYVHRFPLRDAPPPARRRARDPGRRRSGWRPGICGSNRARPSAGSTPP